MSETNKSKKMPFILTSDISTADTLKELGFTYLQEENGKYMFLNDSFLKFDMYGNEIKLDNMCYTNVMCMNQC